METSFEQGDNKQLIFSVADEIPYLRHDDTFGDYYQVLEISEDAIVTERLVKNLPFLKDHDHNVQLGAVKRFWIDTNSKKLYVSVKFSRSRFAQSIRQDIIDMIRQNTSIGYYVNQFERTGQIDGIPVLRAVSWTPYQCSSVSVPASVYVGYNRSLEVKEQKGQDMNAQADKTTSTGELDKEELENKETNLDLENKDVAGEDLEGKSEEATEGKEETVEEKEKELCPECGKEPCECEKADTEEQPTEQTEEKQCGSEPQKKSLDVNQLSIDQLLTDEDKRVIEIRALGKLINRETEAETFVNQKKSLQQFKSYLKNNTNQKKEIHMNNKYFSISKAIRNSCSQYKVDVSEEYETQVIAENKRNLNVQDVDIVLTNNELYGNTRAIDGRQIAPSTAIGAELINTDYLPQEFVTYLRPQLTLEKTGYYSIPVNGNAISFTVCTSGVAAGMYGLDGELSGSDLRFVTKTLTPHKAGALVPINYSVLLQGRPEVDAMVENDIVNALYQIRDEQILNGSGENGQCLGILNTSGINVVTGAVSAGFTWGQMLSAENEIRKANVFSQNLSWVMNGDTYVELQKTMKDQNNCFAGFICENDKIKNFNVYVNNTVPSGTVLLGDFGEVAVADFEGLKLKVDDITYIKQQAIQVVAIKCFDCVVRRPGAFTKIVLS